MATTTKKRFRELFLDAIGFFLVTTTSGTGGASGATVVSTSAGYYEDHIRAGMWMYLPGGYNGSSAAESRRITTVSGATFTPETNFSAQVTSGTAVEFMAFHPEWYHAAMREGIQKSFPVLYRHLLDETIKVDDLLSNWDLETYSTANTPDDWTLANLSAGSTLYKETSRVFQGAASAKLAPTAGDASMRQNVFTGININEMRGKPFYFSAKAWYDGAATVKTRVSFDNGTSFTDSVDHSGLSEWQRLEVNTTIPSTATTATVYLFCGNNQTAYFDDVHARAGRIRKYTIPTSFVGMPWTVSEQADFDPKDSYYKLNKRAKAGRILRLEGQGRLTVPSGETDTIEVDETQAGYIVAVAAVDLFRRLRRAAQTDQFDDDIAYFSREANRLSSAPQLGGVKMAVGALHVPGKWWTHAEDSSGQYLMLP